MRTPRYALADDRIRAVMADFHIDPVRLSRHVIVRALHPDPEKAASMVNALMDLYLRQIRTTRGTRPTPD
ncbi:MAG: hypothetical protein KIT22_00490 [Verrucomicrobiae bacterium]|nr:hypothetical protein [Verrucomicrobiae bacterium]